MQFKWDAEWVNAYSHGAEYPTFLHFAKAKEGMIYLMIFDVCITMDKELWLITLMLIKANRNKVEWSIEKHRVERTIRRMNKEGQFGPHEELILTYAAKSHWVNMNSLKELHTNDDVKEKLDVLRIKCKRLEDRLRLDILPLPDDLQDSHHTQQQVLRRRKRRERKETKRHE